MEDADLLLEWRNDPSTRAASHSVEVVEREDHIKWLASSLDNPNRRLRIVEEDETPVGTVRADLAGGVYELSWTVAPHARGRGIGKQTVALFASELRDPIRAEVKEGNAASAAIAEFAGMKLQRSEGGVLHYHRGPR